MHSKPGLKVFQCEAGNTTPHKTQVFQYDQQNGYLKTIDTYYSGGGTKVTTIFSYVSDTMLSAITPSLDNSQSLPTIFTYKNGQLDSVVDGTLGKGGFTYQNGRPILFRNRIGGDSVVYEYSSGGKLLESRKYGPITHSFNGRGRKRRLEAKVFRYSGNTILGYSVVLGADTSSEQVYIGPWLCGCQGYYHTIIHYYEASTIRNCYYYYPEHLSRKMWHPSLFQNGVILGGSNQRLEMTIPPNTLKEIGIGALFTKIETRTTNSGSVRFQYIPNFYYSKETKGTRTSVVVRSTNQTNAQYWHFEIGY